MTEKRIAVEDSTFVEPLPRLALSRVDRILLRASEQAIEGFGAVHWRVIPMAVKLAGGPVPGGESVWTAAQG